MKNKYEFQPYKDRAGQWRWRLVSLFGKKRIVADSGEGYKRKGTMLKTVNHLIIAASVGRVGIAV